MKFGPSVALSLTARWLRWLEADRNTLTCAQCKSRTLAEPPAQARSVTQRALLALVEKDRDERDGDHEQPDDHDRDHSRPVATQAAT
jgi:hypothetical protein